MDPAGGISAKAPRTAARKPMPRSWLSLMGWTMAIFSISLGSAILIDLGRERVEHYNIQAESSARMVFLYEQNALTAERLAEEAERSGDARKAIRYFDDARGRTKLAEYHRELARFYLKQGVRFWEPAPVDPLPPIVRLIPDRFPGMSRGPRTVEFGFEAGPPPIEGVH